MFWSVIFDYMLSDQLKEIPFSDEKIYIDSICIYKKGIELSKPVKKFLKIIQS